MKANDRNITNQPEPRDLIHRSLNGDPEAFGELVAAYQQYAYALAFRLLLNEEDSEDIVQESFLRVWRHLSEYDPRRKFTTWLYAIVTNLCYDRLRAMRIRTYRPLHEVGASEFTGTGGDSGPEQDYTNQVLRQRLGRLVAGLSPTQRVVFILRDLQELTVKEVAKILKISEGAVKSNLYYARKSLRERLKDFG